MSDLPVVPRIWFEPPAPVVLGNVRMTDADGGVWWVNATVVREANWEMLKITDVAQMPPGEYQGSVRVGETDIPISLSIAWPK